MKKKLGMLLAVLLTFGMTVGVFADAGKTQQVDYKTDYYMIVESPDGGVDMYSEADASSPKLNDELIPNGTAIHVEGETTDEAGKVWVYAQLHGMFGFLEENYLKPATLAEAVASELALYGSKDANYSITVNAKEDGSVCLYKGPGKKYGTVSGGCNIANGEKLYIDTEVDTGKDGIWGHTEAGDVSGWVNIAEATNTEESTVELVPETEKEAEDGSQSVQAGENTSEVGKAGTEGKDSSDVEAEPTGTPTPKPEKTSTPAPKPTESPKPQPTTSPKPTETPNPTPTEAVKPGEKPTPEPAPVEVKANKITLNKENVTFTALNQTFSLSATVTPENAEEKAVGWNSNNMSVVTVDKDGKITAVGKGSAEVFCFLKSNGEVFAKCSVTVQIPDTQPEPTKPEQKPTEPEVVKVSGITLNPDISLKIEEGNSSKVTATVVPSNATNSSVKWVSSSPDVATVDDNGNVTALKAGSTTVTCTAVDGSGVSVSCHVTVTAKSTTTDPSEQDKTDPTYTFTVRGGALDFKSVFNGGDSANILITTDAPIDKLMITMSNNSIQYNDLFYDSEYNYYAFSLYARKKSDLCRVSINRDGKQVWFKDVKVLSDDQNWAIYESWLNGVLENIKGSTSDFDKLNPIQKVTLLGQYILDNYDYNADPNKSFHNDGCGNCNASSFVLKDYAQRLGLRSKVVTPKAYVVNNPSHVVAKVWYDGDAYLIEAGYQGKAGNRGKVTCVKESK